MVDSQYLDLIIFNSRGQIGSVSLKYKGGDLVIHAEDWTARPDAPEDFNPAVAIAECALIRQADVAVPLEAEKGVSPPGPPVSAEFYSDDHKAEAKFDAAAWLAHASDDEIIKVAHSGWGESYETDTIAEFMADRDAGVANVYAYLEFTGTHKITMPYSNDPIGSTCRVDETEALAWLRENRAHIYEELTALDVAVLRLPQKEE